jgi:hypothetical protein
MANNLVPQSSIILKCEKCDYYTCRKSQYDRHLATDKHKKLINTNIELSKVLHHKCCKCNKIYKHKSSLCKHNIKCIKYEQQITQGDTQQLTNLVMKLIDQNQELQKSLIELSKEKTINTTNNNNITNKTFNLHVYLNEDCKDALNINDFVSSIKVQLEDLEETGRLGYVEGVSRIINRTLGDLDQNKRPIQCSDLKRETLYIKDDDKWIKEGEDKEKIKLAIKQIANKNIQQIPVWVKENPGCRDSDSRKNDIYLNIVSNAMAGGNKEEQETNINKIVSKISKEAVIEK